MAEGGGNDPLAGQGYQGFQNPFVSNTAPSIKTF